MPRGDRPDPSETAWLAARLASTLDGEPLATVAARHGVSLSLLRGRLRRGMSTRQAATETPEQARRACRDRATLAVGRTMQRPASSRHTVATVDPDAIAAAGREGYAVHLPHGVEWYRDLLVALARARAVGRRGADVVRVADGAMLCRRSGVL